MTPEQARHIAATYRKVHAALREIWLEAERTSDNASLKKLGGKIRLAACEVDISGVEYTPISEAVSALQGAMDVKKLAGSEGRLAYEKIGTLACLANGLETGF